MLAIEHESTGLSTFGMNRDQYGRTPWSAGAYTALLHPSNEEGRKEKGKNRKAGRLTRKASKHQSGTCAQVPKVGASRHLLQHWSVPI